MKTFIFPFQGKAFILSSAEGACRRMAKGAGFRDETGIGMALLFCILLAACLPEDTGPEVIHWDRDVSAQSGMAISDARFVAQVRAPDGSVHKFDDVGGAVLWLGRQDWQPAEFWVARFDSTRAEVHWIDARQASYEKGPVSPMNFNMTAFETGPLTYAAMAEAVRIQEAERNSRR